MEDLGAGEIHLSVQDRPLPDGILLREVVRVSIPVLAVQKGVDADPTQAMEWGCQGLVLPRYQAEDSASVAAVKTRLFEAGIAVRR
jgi:hypothetical protein